jgi:hypothetical protein
LGEIGTKIQQQIFYSTPHTTPLPLDRRDKGDRVVFYPGVLLAHCREAWVVLILVGMYNSLVDDLDTFHETPIYLYLALVLLALFVIATALVLCIAAGEMCKSGRLMRKLSFCK